MPEAPRTLSVIVVPDGGQASRTYTLSYRTLRWMTIGVAIVALLLGAMTASWWYLASQAARAEELAARVARLEEERERVRVFADQLEDLERQYGRIRGLFGSESSQVTSELWLPPPPSVRSAGEAPPGQDDALPTSWPLTERGFVTQPLLEGAEGEHPGLDIATPTDSYVRAAGAGTVVEAGEDPVYGRYVAVDHGGGYRSLYGHASTLLVERGQRVRRNEVIALSGSTGRSTAPHLHFEILLEGEPVDPLTLVSQP